MDPTLVCGSGEAGMGDGYGLVWMSFPFREHLGYLIVNIKYLPQGARPSLGLWLGT